MPRGPFNFHLQSSDHTSSLIPPPLCRVVLQLSPTIVRPQLLFDTTGFMPRGPFNFHLQSSDHSSSLIPPALCRVVLSTFTYKSSAHISSSIPPALCRVVLQLSPTIVRPQFPFVTTGFIPRGPSTFTYHR